MKRKENKSIVRARVPFLSQSRVPSPHPHTIGRSISPAEGLSTLGSGWRMGRRIWFSSPLLSSSISFPSEDLSVKLLYWSARTRTRMSSSDVPPSFISQQPLWRLLSSLIPSPPPLFSLSVAKSCCACACACAPSPPSPAHLLALPPHPTNLCPIFPNLVSTLLPLPSLCLSHTAKAPGKTGRSVLGHLSFPNQSLPLCFSIPHTHTYNTHTYILYLFHSSPGPCRYRALFR